MFQVVEILGHLLLNPVYELFDFLLSVSVVIMIHRTEFASVYDDELPVKQI